MKIINLYNHKGGVGKTTISLHLANKLSLYGKTLIIELDDQANILIGSNLQNEVQQIMDNGDLYPLGVLPLMQNSNIENFIYSSDKSKFDVIVNNELNGLEASLKDDFFELLFNKIESLSKYEFVIIDNPPSKYETVIQCLKKSTSIFIPFDCEESSTKAVLDTLVSFTKKDIDLDSVLGVIPNKFLHFHQSIHNQNIDFVKQAISFEGSKMKVYNTIKNSKQYKEIERTSEYPDLLDDVVKDILESKNSY